MRFFVFLSNQKMYFFEIIKSLMRQSSDLIWEIQISLLLLLIQIKNSFLTNSFSKIVEKHVPLKKRTLRRNRAPFVSKELRKAIYNGSRFRNRYLKPRLQYMKNMGVQQSHASSQNSEAIDMWKVACHPPSRHVVTCDDYSF